MSKEPKERLDVLLVNRRLADSREKAKAIIMTGNVFVNGQREDKAGSMFPETVEIELKGVQMKYVSRGGYKLEKAVEKHGIDLTGCTCMDVGSSTGGFTDCMLQNGAVKVFAIDVGTNQLAWKLRSDERVVSMEQTNIRYVTPADIGGEPVDFVSIDVAFISLTKVLLPVRNLMKQGATIVCLIKPQFEAGREQVGKKGVVRDPKVHEEVIVNVLNFATAIGFELINLDFSPIRGPEGNIEYLAYMRNSYAGDASTGVEQNDRIFAETDSDSSEPDETRSTAEEDTKKDISGSLSAEIMKLISTTVSEAHNSI